LDDLVRTDDVFGGQPLCRAYRIAWRRLSYLSVDAWHVAFGVRLIEAGLLATVGR
jgi:hypothetical protein